MTLPDRVRSVIAQQLGCKPERVVPRASLADDLGADSLDRCELIMALEDAFNRSIPDEDAEGWETVGDVVRYVEGAT